MNLGYTLSGFMVGILVGVTGVGGGSLMTPLLVFLFGFKPAVAVGTDLLFAAITKTGGVWVHHGKHGSVDWKIVGWLGMGSIPFAIITLFVLKHFMAVGQGNDGGHYVYAGYRSNTNRLFIDCAECVIKQGGETQAY